MKLFVCVNFSQLQNRLKFEPNPISWVFYMVFLLLLEIDASQKKIKNFVKTRGWFGSPPVPTCGSYESSGES